MCGLIQYSWSGAGRGWPEPGEPGSFLRSASQTPRWFPRNPSLSSEIMSGGAQNRADFASTHAGVEAESVKAYKQNFQS